MMNLNEANFETEVIKSSEPVLVDFWAEHCEPCKALGPILDELAIEYAGKMKVGKVNTDESPSLCAQLRITSIPTIMIFKNEREQERFVGLRGKNDLKIAIDRLLED